MKLTGKHVAVRNRADERLAVGGRRGHDAPVSGRDDVAVHEIEVLGPSDQIESRSARTAIARLGRIPADMRNLQGLARQRIAPGA